MQITIQSIHFNADQKLLDFIQRKLDKLENFHNKIISGEVFLKLDHADNRENKITEIKLHVPGTTLFSNKKCKSFEEGTDLAVEALVRQLEKTKKD